MNDKNTPPAMGTIWKYNDPCMDRKVKVVGFNAERNRAIVEPYPKPGRRTEVRVFAFGGKDQRSYTEVKE